ncbi:F0F1 ATP synthase subunit B [Pontibacter sp. BT310]|uniref:ATP synthase subunit b n=1 Tax=Pontibacter populi TaxID=890055 RepID=A0ABS6X9G8_9BACT|nr:MULTISPECIES: F0F1 ATP synthase subunit B [Pontibacter]MBJ6117793.1 F0F1 ATP synthase subunit B [Pontibacter sp. BT310]MBR0570219.1 F0F1 ATP synthase subunit B [Microvirga sp. STS03]MBW3364645.1 F0F1 ATP synthase subunit B [Pontibacter populi]
MELVTPGFGLIFWQLVTFLIVLFLLTKFAWKPIMNALRERETSIENALSAAEKAKLEMQGLKTENEKLLAEARLERDKILKEASDAGNALVENARNKANEEGSRMIAQAREAIENEKRAAITEVKNMAAALSVDIAERILRKELNDPQAQQALAQDYIREVTLN